MTRIARPGDAFPNGLVGKVMGVMPKNVDGMYLDPENFTEYDGVHLALGTGVQIQDPHSFGLLSQLLQLVGAAEVRDGSADRIDFASGRIPYRLAWESDQRR